MNGACSLCEGSGRLEGTLWQCSECDGTGVRAIVDLDDRAQHDHRLSLDERFRIFHESNPHVYVELVRLARRLESAGAERIGIAQLFEVLRYRHALRTNGEAFKLNNDYRSRYARMIIEREPDLRERAHAALRCRVFEQARGSSSARPSSSSSSG